MQKVMERLGGAVGMTITAVGLALNKLVALSGLDHTKGRSPGKRITAIGLAYTCLVGSMNLISTRGLSFDLFYLFGCAAVGWGAGVRPALLVALASGVFVYFDAVQTGAVSLPGWIVYWNSALRIVGFGATGWLAAQAGRLTRGLERTIHERTGRLQNEVAEHKETTVRLRETVDLFKQVTENITEVFWVTDPAKNRVNYVSRGFEKVWGRPRQAIYSCPAIWLDAVHPQDRDRVTQAMYTQQIAGEYDEEYRVRRPDGSVCWVHDRAFPVLNERSEVYRIVGIAEDITERKRAEQLMEAQRDISAALSITSDLRAALQRLLEAATRLEGIDCGGVYLAQENGALDLAAHRGLSPAFVSRVAHYEADSSEVALVREGRMLYPICGPEWNTEGSFWSGEGLRALAVLPLQHEGEMLGALSLGSHEQDEIPPQMRVALETVTAQAAGAIARIRLEREILEISDREQARIGQDIHDGLCQLLIGAAFSANSLQQLLRQRDPSEASSAAKFCSLLDEAITESRRVCRGLYPVRLKTDGLVPALEELANTVSERFNIQCGLQTDLQHVSCDLTTSTHLYRIAQEAVNNAVKHSGSRHICIQLNGAAGEIELMVRDDGAGIKGALHRSSGMGLHIMDYRARSIGGRLYINGNPAGTVVSCRVPQIGDPISGVLAPQSQ